jgi:hypothetical protein
LHRSSGGNTALKCARNRIEVTAMTRRSSLTTALCYAAATSAKVRIPSNPRSQPGTGRSVCWHEPPAGSRCFRPVVARAESSDGPFDRVAWPEARSSGIRRGAPPWSRGCDRAGCGWGVSRRPPKALRHQRHANARRHSRDDP